MNVYRFNKRKARLKHNILSTLIAQVRLTNKPSVAYLNEKYIVYISINLQM